MSGDRLREGLRRHRGCWRHWCQDRCLSLNHHDRVTVLYRTRVIRASPERWRQHVRTIRYQVSEGTQEIGWPALPRRHEHHPRIPSALRVGAPVDEEAVLAHVGNQVHQIVLDGVKDSALAGRPKRRHRRTLSSTKRKTLSWACESQSGDSTQGPIYRRQDKNNAVVAARFSPTVSM